ncbi:hypothetical protein J6590_017223 [Homalodisca vitripennis]|nr:hypothetical protein J6590_017223 [Homalodisca vitripennis]
MDGRHVRDHSENCWQQWQSVIGESAAGRATYSCFLQTGSGYQSFARRRHSENATAFCGDSGTDELDGQHNIWNQQNVIYPPRPALLPVVWRSLDTIGVRDAKLT